MIKQINSHDINQILHNAQERLGDAEKDLDLMKERMANALAIMYDENIWHQHCQNELAYIGDTPYHLVPLYKNVDGAYMTFFYDVLPQLVKEPLNVFNIQSTQTVFFRDDVSLFIAYEDGRKEDVTTILKHDALKNTFFHRHFEQKEIVMTLAVKDYQQPLGASRFNMIEIDAFMPGSFTLKSIELIYGDEVVPYTDFYRLGKNRILLEEKKQIDRIDFTFELLHAVTIDNKTVYPFAIKHLYLLDADFKEDSYVIAKVSCQQPVATIQDACIISSNRGIQETTLKSLGVEAYAHYADNQLYMPLVISTPYQMYDIPLQLTDFYIRVPLYRALTNIGLTITH